MSVDLDLLADYVGGALDGTPEAERVAQLIATDDAWRTQYELLTSALAGVAEDMAMVAGAPEPMPEDIAARFDELLASPELAPVKAVPSRPAVGERALERRPARTARWRRWAAPISIAAGVLALAGLTVPGILSGQFDQGSPGDAYDTNTSAAEELKEFSTLGGPPVTFSGTEYSRDSFPTGRASMPFSAEPRRQVDSAGGEAALSRLTGEEALQACLRVVSNQLPGTVTALDFASFEGVPALIISIQAADGPWIVVVGAQCGIDGMNELYRVKTG